MTPARIIMAVVKRNGTLTFMLKLILTIFGISLLSQGTESLEIEYMESGCGTSRTFSTSFQLDSSTGMTYLNLLDCNYTVTAPSGHYVLAIVTRFELEAAFSGTCKDYLDVHDGADTSATKLNSNLVCGACSSIPSNFTSTGQSMTLRFVTDNSGVYHGFNLIFVAVTDAPCSSSKYACNTSICIDSSLRCDGYNQCGDISDEDNCTESGSSDQVDIVMIVVIVLSVVAVIGITVAFIIYKIHERNQWKKFVNSHIDDDDGIVEPGPSYPVTYKYYRGARGHPAYYSSNVTAGQSLSESKNEKGAGEHADIHSQPSTSSAVS